MTIRNFIKNSQYKDKYVLEKLLCHHLNYKRTDLRTKREEQIPQNIENKIISDYKRYIEDKEPMEYILWYVEFFNRKFIVNESTLVPRPETEYMIEATNEYIQKNKQSKFLILDIWTWCWVLWTSIMLENIDNCEKLILTEYFPEALKTATQNYKKLTKNKKTPPVEFIKSDLLQFITKKDYIRQWTPTILVANLPYIPDKMFEENSPENCQKREPKLAFVWWNDWLDLYRQMFDQLIAIGNRSKNKLTMFLEMMTRQTQILQEEYRDTLDFTEVKTFHFNIRILKCTFKNNS